MALVVIGTGVFVINDTLMKATSGELPLGEIVTIRGIMSCCFMAPIVMQKFREQAFEDVAYFEPYYLKDFIAGVPKVKGLR